MINDHPPLIVYDEDKHAYYDALHQDEALAPLAEFFREETAKTWRRALELSQGQRQPRRGLSELL